MSHFHAHARTHTYTHAHTLKHINLKAFALENKVGLNNIRLDGSVMQGLDEAGDEQVALGIVVALVVVEAVAPNVNVSTYSFACLNFALYDVALLMRSCP